jgi:hypothetical protein
MTIKFPNSLKHARELDDSLWALGDALVKETSGSRADFLAVAAELGDSYPVKRLRDLRATSLAFPPERRRRVVSWEAHCAAGNPDTLDPIVLGMGDRVTSRVVREVIKGMKKSQND